MPLWGMTDANTSVPKFAGALVNQPANTLIARQMYDGTKKALWVPGSNVQVFGIDTTEQANTQLNKGAAHAGWVVTKEGTGGRAGRTHSEVIVAGGSIS